MNKDEFRPETQIGDALFIERDGGLREKSTYTGPDGIRRTFYQDGDLTTNATPETQKEKFEMVMRFIRELIDSKIPLMLKTKSNLGELSEKLFLGMRQRPAKAQDQNELMGGEALSAVSFCIYAKGTGYIISSGQFGLVGHRDIILAEDSDGEFVYDDKKLMLNDYYPPPEAQWQFWKSNLYVFDDATTIKRWKPELHDPYNVGIGSLLQGTTVAWMLHNLEKARIKTNILFPDGVRMWKKYGLETLTGAFDRSVAIDQIVKDIFTHIR